VPGPEAASFVARGDAEIAVALLTEIVSVPGVLLVGALPAELQSPTNFVYVAAIAQRATQPDTANQLIKFLSGADAAPVYKSRGMEPE
jgi:molybdate transport system substrate-binding protein